MGSWLTVLLDTLANKYIILVTFNSSSERPSSLAMIKSSISSYQDQLATFVGIVCQDKKARPQKHSELVLNLKNNQFNSWQSYRQGIHILQAQDLPFEAPKVR